LKAIHLKPIDKITKSALFKLRFFVDV